MYPARTCCQLKNGLSSQKVWLIKLYAVSQQEVVYEVSTTSGVLGRINFIRSKFLLSFIIQLANLLI